MGKLRRVLTEHAIINAGVAVIIISELVHYGHPPRDDCRRFFWDVSPRPPCRRAVTSAVP